jgi:hypothetical protein
MRRGLKWVLGASAAVAVSATTATAQTHVDVGIWTPNGGGRVVIGSPRVYVPAPVYRAPETVYVVEREHRHGHGKPHGRAWGARRKQVTVTRVYEVRGPYPERVYLYEPSGPYYGGRRGADRDHRR